MWPRRHYPRCRKIPERTSNISSRKRKASLDGLRDNLLGRVQIAYRHVGDHPHAGIAVRVGFGSAGGIAAVVGAAGDGDSFTRAFRAGITPAILRF
jgi:hypothetical protein